MTTVITTDDASYGFGDGNDGGGAVAAEVGELDGLEAHGDFLVYSWPAKALWLKQPANSSCAPSATRRRSLYA